MAPEGVRPETRLIPDDFVDHGTQGGITELPVGLRVLGLRTSGRPPGGCRVESGSVSFVSLRSHPAGQVRGTHLETRKGTRTVSRTKHSWSGWSRWRRS